MESAMRCQEIMKSEVECFRAHDPVTKIARCMRDVNIGFVPIVDDDGHPLGAITDRDIALRVCAADKLASQTLASEVMTHEAVACRATDDLALAEELMRQHRKSRLMIVNEQGRLVGVLSLSDIVEQETDWNAAEMLREIADREVHESSAPSDFP
jgi:CBS domain-containing protein